MTMSTLSESLPAIDLDVFLSLPEQSVRVQEECKKVIILLPPTMWAIIDT